MKFSVRFNNDISPHRFAPLAALAEEAGFDQIWVSNDLFWESAAVLVSAAASSTERIALGVGVFNPVSMHTSEIAMITASLDELTQGRFMLGLGAGADRFLAWAGLHPQPPVVRTRTALLELRDLLRGEAPTSFERNGVLRTRSVATPIYVGAMGPHMLELAGELADGALPLLFPPERYERARKSIAAGARRADRDVADLDVVACVWCSIDDDAAAAGRAMARKIAYYGPSFSRDLLRDASLSRGDFAGIEQALSAQQPERAVDLVTPAMLRLGIVGSAADVVERCAGLVAAGAEHISFGPPLGPDVEHAIKTIGREVMPALRNLRAEPS